MGVDSGSTDSAPTEKPGLPRDAVSVIVADAFFVVSATEVAVNVTVAGVGAVAGAV